MKRAINLEQLKQVCTQHDMYLKPMSAVEGFYKNLEPCLTESQIMKVLDGMVVNQPNNYFAMGRNAAINDIKEAINEELSK